MDRRAQTNVDFAVGTTIFLLTVAFTFAFVPGMLQPFDAASDSTLVADRVATQLGTDALGDPAEPYVLNETCTEGFFRQLRGVGPDAPDGCRFDAGADSLGAVVGTDRTTSLNVTVFNQTTGAVAKPGGTLLTTGSTVPDVGSVAVARRAVSVNGTTYRLEVREW